MSARTFVFCDLCNPDALRNVEQRRGPERGDYDGRRFTDGRAWIESDVETAMQEHGWILTTGGAHICSRCVEQAQAAREAITPHEHDADSGRSFIFCDCCNAMGIRYIEQRRESSRNGNGDTRRITDGRAWFENNDSAAVENGWLITEDGKHYCPQCKSRHPNLGMEIEVDQVALPLKTAARS